MFSFSPNKKIACFIYPNQLFYNNILLEQSNYVYIIEEPIFFTKFKFHKLKLIFHRASMKAYYDFIILKYPHLQNNVSYIDYNNVNYDNIYKQDYNNIILYNPCDYKLNEKLKKYNINYFDTPCFIETIDELTTFRENYTNKKTYHHDTFYKWQRIRLKILIDNNNKPLYGKWSFDRDNRKKFDKDYQIPSEPIPIKNKYIDEAIIYVNNHFSNNFGIISDDNFIYPIDHISAKLLFKDFINNKLVTFGKYEDASSNDIKFGSHSLISILLNVGLLTPDYVINKTLDYFKKFDDKNKIINSIEGFIRQVIGWRSYMHFIYVFHGQEMFNMNKFNHLHKLDKRWYTGNIGILPIDNLIEKVNKYAYLHHIERLMYMGNFGLLCKINPKDIYKWFMICFIDSFEWVMVGNVFGMSQYSLENISIMSKPYFSSSNYILKMSNYKKDKWCIIWDALYYNFINSNINIFKNIYSIAPSIKYWNKKTKQQRDEILQIANTFLY